MRALRAGGVVRCSATLPEVLEVNRAGLVGVNTAW